MAKEIKDIHDAIMVATREEMPKVLVMAQDMKYTFTDEEKLRIEKVMFPTLFKMRHKDDGECTEKD